MTLPHFTRLTHAGSLILLLTMLSACGFQLRGVASATLPAELKVMRVTAGSGLIYPPFVVDIRSVLQSQAGVQLVDAPGVPTLTLLEERADSQILSIDSTGKVSSYLLDYRLTFKLTDAAGKELLGAQSVKLQREYSFDKLSVLAKEKEDEFLRNEMRRDAAQQILRRLASVGR
jgi:LPS-assembly lipoprotein